MYFFLWRVTFKIQWTHELQDNLDEGVTLQRKKNNFEKKRGEKKADASIDVT